MRRWGGVARFAAGAAVVLLAAGCAVPDRSERPDRAGPPTVERLAAAAGCAPSIETGAAGLREGTCLTARGSYVLATFRTAEGLQAWLAASQTYDGSYLVGERWVVAGPASALRPMQSRLGGDLRPGARQSG